MPLPITALYTALLALLLVVLTQLVIRTRVGLDFWIGDGGHPELVTAMRRQANFVESVPIALILMLLAETAGAEDRLLHATGILLVAARLIHPFGISTIRPKSPLRIIGAVGTMLATLILIVTLGYQHFG